MKEFNDDNVHNVLKQDGIIDIHLEKEYENLSKINIMSLAQKLGKGSWAVRLVYNKRFGGVLIQQQTGEGNRRHYHPNADENWVILDGIWEWWIDGKGTKKVTIHDIVVVP